MRLLGASRSAESDGGEMTEGQLQTEKGEGTRVPGKALPSAWDGWRRDLGVGLPPSLHPLPPNPADGMLPNLIFQNARWNVINQTTQDCQKKSAK